ncbi:MAG: hypothetical protein M3Y87_35355 [Myxococcota bacterium]|nr:hypothetical protein [Myxococcota bacterium]
MTLESLERERRPREVAAEALELRAVAAVDRALGVHVDVAHLGMQSERRGDGTQRAHELGGALTGRRAVSPAVSLRRRFRSAIRSGARCRCDAIARRRSMRCCVVAKTCVEAYGGPGRRVGCTKYGGDFPVDPDLGD